MDEYNNLYNTHFTKLEELASRLLEHKYESPKDLWQIQIDLVNYQIELREDIRKEKASKKETNAKISDVVKLRKGNWKLA
ncbi:MAG: hypothetical protein ABWZ66_03895, partial [Pyrinomonadaceae bacterium]